MSLSDSFGDSYLMEHNSIFRKIREMALQFGFQYSNLTNPPYEILPLVQLENILKSRTLPYRNNFSILQSLESTHANRFFWDDLTDQFKRSYHFHESCHAVARATRQLIWKNEQKNSKEAEILQLLCEESFANACEFMGLIDCHDQTHKIFYECHSYICHFEARSLLNELSSVIGMRSVFEFLILSYLFSNYLRDSLSEKDLPEILELLKISKSLSQKEVKKLRSLSKFSFELNSRFRYVTTNFYLQFLGFDTSNKEIESIKFFPMMKENSEYLEFIKKLSVNF